MQPLRVFVLQVRQRLAEHHALAAAVAVNQREMAVRFGRKRRGDNGQHRGDPGACRNRQIVPFALCLGLVAKLPLGNHHLQRHPRFDLVPGIAGKAPAFDGFDRHTDLARSGTPADGVAAAQLIPAQRRFQGQVLAGTKAVGFLQRLRHRERDGHRVAGFGFHFCHC